MTNVARRLPFTYRELVLMPDDGKRRELIDGDVFPQQRSTKPYRAVSNTP